MPQHIRQAWCDVTSPLSATITEKTDTPPRTALNSASPDTLETHMTVARNQVSDPWIMDKDGHSWWSIDERIALAQWRASWKARSDQERAAIETRVLRKLMSK